MCHNHLILDTQKLSTIFEKILNELDRAASIHPLSTWNVGLVQRAAFVIEEAGELIQACNTSTQRETPNADDLHNIEKEAVQTAAMAIKMILSLEVDKKGVMNVS